MQPDPQRDAQEMSLRLPDISIVVSCVKIRDIRKASEPLHMRGPYYIGHRDLGVGREWVPSVRCLRRDECYQRPKLFEGNTSYLNRT